MFTQSQYQEALDKLPQSGEVGMDQYKAQLQTSYPSNWKEILEAMLKQQAVKKRLDLSPDAPSKVMFSRKA